MLDPITTAAANGLASKSLDEIAKPVSKLIGEDLARFYITLRQAIANPEIKPVRVRYAEFLQEVVDRVDPKNAQLPRNDILGPALEAIRYQQPGSEIDKAFSRLLSAAFDRERSTSAHPAFPHIIRSLDDDEIAFVRALARRDMTFIHGYEGGGGYKKITPDEAHEALPFLKHPERAELYLEHINSLGLLSHILVSGSGQHQSSGRYAGMTDLHFDLSLSSLGRSLAATVLDDPSGDG